MVVFQALAHKRECEPYRAYATADPKSDICVRTEVIKMLNEVRGLIEMQSGHSDKAAYPQIRFFAIDISCVLECPL